MGALARRGLAIALLAPALQRQHGRRRGGSELARRSAHFTPRTLLR